MSTDNINDIVKYLELKNPNPKDSFKAIAKKLMQNCCIEKTEICLDNEGKMDTFLLHN